MITPTEKDRSFINGFAVFLVFLIMLYIFAVTFWPVSTNGAKYADIAVPLLLGTGIGGVLGYFFGASKPQPPTATTFPQVTKVELPPTPPVVHELVTTKTETTSSTESKA